MDGREIRFEKEKSFMIIDDHKGYYPFEMKYDWVDLESISLSLTASIGLVGIQQLSACLDLDQLLQTAQAAMQQAIEAGRNRSRIQRIGVLHN